MHWRERLDAHLRRYYRTTVDEVEPATSSGYWRKAAPCAGRGACRQPIHGCLWNEGPIHHTVTYFDDPRDSRGRFISPYRTWNEARAASAP